METACNFCHDGGYLSFETYCECKAGIFYESKDEYYLQIAYHELDIGLDDESKNDDSFEVENVSIFFQLPFNICDTKI